jgi:hypothetical protein
MFQYIIIFLIALILLFFYMKSNYNSKNNLSPVTKNETLDLVDHSKSNIVNDIKIEKVVNKTDDIERPNYLIEDETNFAKKELLILLSKINKQPIKLKSPCNYKFYNHATMDDLLRRTIDEISDRVLVLINKNGDYDFQKANYGNIEVWIDALGNKEYKYELFVSSLKHYFQLKLNINVIKFIKKNNMKSYGITNSPYVFPTYHNGFPCKDQLIPAPHEVIPSANIVLSTNSMKPDDVEKAQYMYLNNVDIENSTLVINANIQNDKEFIMDVGENGGIIDNKLEYTHLNNNVKPNPIQPISREANKWVETPDKPNYMGQYPCKVMPEMWDEDGIYYYSKARDNQLKEEVRDYDVCVGTRSSTEPLPLQPNFWINNYAESGTGVNCGPNSWLFSNYSGPMGTFFGGGKK